MSAKFDHAISEKAFQEIYTNFQLNSIFENVFAFFGMLNEKGFLINLQGKAFEKTNLNPELLSGQKFSETVFWQSSESTSKMLDKSVELAASGTGAKVLLDFRLSSEEKLFVEMNLQPVSEKGEIFFCAYDVTEREREIDYHRQRSEQLLYAAESAEIGLWSWDLTNNHVYSTPKCNELFETSAYDSLIYDSFVNILHPEDRERVETVLHESQMTGKEYNEQFRVIYSEGRIEWISARGKTFLDSEGNPLKMMGVVRKITDQKSAEQDLSRVYDREKKARDEAEEANRAKDFFLAFVSHELRSPLNAILGWSKILLSKKVDEETQKNALETIERSARSQAKLINDLVDSARIASGKLRLEFHPVNLYEIVKTVFHSQKPTAENKNINLTLDSNSENINIFADTGRLQQVFNNLISNSLKFTPDGGEISINIAAQNQTATVTIKDNGQGISADLLPNVFRQFAQGDEGLTTPDRGGLGLGLSIVKILVEKHNGVVAAESAGIGHGSLFKVTLPLLTVDAETLTETESNSEPSDAKLLGGVSILLVEDDVDSREVLGLFLEQCGAAVLSAASAREALDVLQNSAAAALPHVIISDLAMPDEDGYSLISRIRRLPPQFGGKISAIALSAFATNENKQRAFEAGFDKYSTKPFDPDLLIEEILSLVKK